MVKEFQSMFWTLDHRSYENAPEEYIFKSDTTINPTLMNKLVDGTSMNHDKKYHYLNLFYKDSPVNVKFYDDAPPRSTVVTFHSLDLASQFSHENKIKVDIHRQICQESRLVQTLSHLRKIIEAFSGE
jgi:hypothetical protein